MDGGAWFIDCNAAPVGRNMSLLQNNQPVLNARPEQTVTWLSATVIVTGSLSVRTPLGSLSLVLLEIGLGLGFASDLSKCCLSPCRSRLQRLTGDGKRFDFR